MIVVNNLTFCKLFPRKIKIKIKKIKERGYKRKKYKGEKNEINKKIYKK